MSKHPDPQQELKTAELRLHLWAQGIQGRIEQLELQQSHLEREITAYEEARAALFCDWLKAHRYVWCAQCDAIVEPYMAPPVFRETYSLTDEHYRADLLETAVINACHTCASGLVHTASQLIRWRGDRHVEHEFYGLRTTDAGTEVCRKTWVRDEDAPPSDSGWSDLKPGPDRWEPLPEGTLTVTGPKRVSPHCARIARLPPSKLVLPFDMSDTPLYY